MLPIDISALPGGVVSELLKGRHAKNTLTLLKAPETQLRLARENNVEHRSIDGLGQPRLSITPEAYHYWGQRLGYQCWSDKQFLNEFERDNPACRIKSKGTRIQSGSAGESLKPDVAGLTSENGKRFTKSSGR